MLGKKPSEREQTLDDLIDEATTMLRMIGPTHEEYDDIIARIERLNKLKLEDKPESVSRDTLAMIGANLLGILIIVAYEQKHVFTSKAFGSILRPKT